MPLALNSVVGTIRIDSLLDEPARLAGDDSTLALLLGEFAHSERLAEEDQPLRLVAAARLSVSDCGPSQASVRADLARLLDDLQREYDELNLPQCP